MLESNWSQSEDLPLNQVIKNSDGQILRQILCFSIDKNHLDCNGTLYDEKENPLSAQNPVFWIYLGIYVVLVLVAGMMSGLTLGILSLDLTSLKVLQAAGDSETARFAKSLIPLVNRRHLVLVALVLTNAFAVEAMPIFMDRISDPITAILISCTAVLIFGEVLPQAVTSRYGLRIGYHFSWLVWALVCVLFPIALPFSYLLDILLGKDLGTFYGRKELQALVDIHGPPSQIDVERNGVLKNKNPFSCVTCTTSGSLYAERLTEDEVMIIKGALTMSSKIATHAMVKLEDVFMLSVDTIFDHGCLKEIFEIGHSRIPVYEGDKKNVLGVFLTKRLITIDPNQRITLRHLIEDTSFSKAFYTGLRINEKMPLYELLNRFQTGTLSHIAFVTKKSESGTDELIGIVTLEDVIEELLQEEIFDESDVKRKNSRFVSLALPKIYRQLNAASKVIEPNVPLSESCQCLSPTSAQQFGADGNDVTVSKILARHRSLQCTTAAAASNGHIVGYVGAAPLLNASSRWSSSDVVPHVPISTPKRLRRLSDLSGGGGGGGGDDNTTAQMATMSSSSVGACGSLSPSDAAAAPAADDDGVDDDDNGDCGSGIRLKISTIIHDDEMLNDNHDHNNFRSLRRIKDRSKNNTIMFGTLASPVDDLNIIDCGLQQASSAPQISCSSPMRRRIRTLDNSRQIIQVVEEESNTSGTIAADTKV